MAISKRKDRNIVYASGGDCYLAPERPDGSNEGEFDFGDTPTLSLSIETETVDTWLSDGLVKEKKDTLTTSVTRSGTLTVTDIQPKTVALFVGGTSDPIKQTAGSVSGESIDSGLAVVGDRSYQLGTTDDQPMGARGISAVVVKDSKSEPETYTENTDYEVDLARGRIRVLPDSDLDGITGVVVSYTRPSATFAGVATSDVVGIHAGLRLISKNAAGKQFDVFGPRVFIRPSGDFQVKGSDSQQTMTFEVEFTAPGDGRAALYLNGLPA